MIPNLRTDGFHIGVGEQIKHLQVARIAHGLRKVDHELIVVDIAAEGGMCENEVAKDEKFELLRIVDVKSEPPSDRPRDVAALFRVTATEPFADIVKHQSEVEN